MWWGLEVCSGGVQGLDGFLSAKSLEVCRPPPLAPPDILSLVPRVGKMCNPHPHPR